VEKILVHPAAPSYDPTAKRVSKRGGDASLRVGMTNEHGKEM
jgi:hypothetical protein